MTAELHAAGDAVANGLREATTSIEAVHRQISRRAFGASPASPAARTHDLISGLVYAGVRGGLTLGARGGALAAALTRSRWETPQRTRAGAVARAALNGAFGDALAADGNALAIPMAVRVDGQDVPLHRGALLEAFPEASPRLVIFLHGLCESDAHWRSDQPDGYGPSLARDLGLTPVVLRYNTGLRVSENGAALSGLLSRLVLIWPQRVLSLALVGHSMGGLVIRSACSVGVAADASWVGLTRTAVYLGTPHGGAPLEKGARALSAALARVPETRPAAAAIERRSVGIKDLGDGLVGADLHVPLHDGIRHHAVSAAVGGQPLVSHLLGDLLVRRGSAAGRGTRTRPDLTFGAGDVHHVPNANHFHLLSHPAVYAQLRDWLAESRDQPARRRRLQLPRRTGEAGRRGPR